ncbi:adenosine deaminase family protein [Galbitalea soli]|uniref:adenosine deaminase n=1 Tax=Galbitalea soli TaxID=1268042 RepID=A0A7C9TSZ9_9MICO|nr:adenosine deaminase family protein [Galbitalea soli]NEM92062.1 adenosine deaminase family protein [Galbitalea soli]NYJ31986.1 adenosine deaminase [Galbitalea soli]
MTDYPRWRQDDDEAFLAMPKISLHDHLDGSLRPETIVELATARGVWIPHTDPATLAGWFQGTVTEPAIGHWDEMFGILTAVMQDQASIRRVAREFVLELAADGVVYGEARWAPEKHLAGGLSLDEAVLAVAAGLAEGEAAARAEGSTIRVRQLLCAMRTSDRSLEIAELTVRHYGASVVGFDLAGEEAGYPASAHRAAFALLDAHDIPYTIHSGELAGVESLQDTLHTTAPQRIGHGIRIIEDVRLDDRPLAVATAAAQFAAAPRAKTTVGPTAARVRDRRVPLEVCVSSNSGGYILSGRENHPMGLLHRLGFTVTVSPDNRLISATSVSAELRHITRLFGWTMADHREAQRAAARAAFLSEPDRRALLETVIEPWFAERL